MIYNTFEQIEYGFVLLEINKKHLDINRFWKYKIWQGLPKRTFTVSDVPFVNGFNLADSVFPNLRPDDVSSDSGNILIYYHHV